MSPSQNTLIGAGVQTSYVHSSISKLNSECHALRKSALEYDVNKAFVSV